MCGVFLLQELHGALVEGGVEVIVAQAVGQHDLLQIALGRFQRGPFLDGLERVAVVAQFLDGLHVERHILVGITEIVGTRHFGEVAEPGLVVGIECRNGADGCAPLPQGKGVFEHTVVVDVLFGQIEVVVASGAEVVEHGHQFGLALHQFLHGSLYRLAFFFGAHLLGQKLLVAAILDGAVERCHITDTHIDIVGVGGAVEHGGLASLADAGADPFAREELAEHLTHMVIVGQRVIDGHVVPVGGHGHTLRKVAVFAQDDVGIEQCAQFFLIVGVQPVVGKIAFGHEHRRLVQPLHAHDDALAEGAL